VKYYTKILVFFLIALVIFSGGAVNGLAGSVIPDVSIIPNEGCFFLPERPASRGTVAITVYNVADNKAIREAGAGANKSLEPVPDGHIVFSDVPTDSPYYASVSYCASRGYISGYPDGTFVPEGFVTRAEMCVILSKLLSLSTDGYAKLPPDVPSWHWASDSITAVIGSGIMSGYEDKTFRPDNKLTRAELATIIVTAVKLQQPGYIREFSDVPRTHWAYKSIACVSVPSVPEPSVYEAEVAALVNKARAKVGAKELGLDPLLCEIARIKAREMGEKDYFDHESPTWGTPREMLGSFGFADYYPAENLGCWYRTPSEVVSKWVESPDHYKNMTDKAANKTGVGYAMQKDGIAFWVMILVA